ncbi:hypothetical protein D554_0689 [Bordetella holmesii 30539]|uniref:N-acetyltransferase YedL n=1 Tax=Bordetella holmesii 1058 TaxID=1247648 RepID=A0ABN0S297_9BORD|nr:hypothetical protein D560_1213 [Bordetella holmesii ATCC 51541]AIT25879.1 hypothetical protein D558_1201 [Bordetella holmesii 44057]EWM44415.1 hypothetical protein D556_1209 [Bordetella holmesii 41130]EWM46447.1 hypothetical protein D555_1222 [Bordetella holmesii 35009]EWM50612.1 hypothetical protein D557_0457 [Bordetella holmesii 70147]EXF89489.1 hypothetical protein D554_0689 [Bordetella holmesii 30539]EXX95697.1 hypothetical protein D559_3135 [Bordetella holmesii 1058]
MAFALYDRSRNRVLHGYVAFDAHALFAFEHAKPGCGKV